MPPYKLASLITDYETAKLAIYSLVLVIALLGWMLLDARKKLSQCRDKLQLSSIIQPTKSFIHYIGGRVPRYKQFRWNGYGIKLFATEQDILRIFPIIPYYWDSNIELDLVVDRPKKGLGSDAPQIQYAWKLYDSDEQVVREGQDSYVFNLAYKLPSMGRKHRAFKIGYLKPHQYYKLEVTFTDNYGSRSDPLLAASFTIKDRDEVFTQILIALVVIILGIIIGFMARGCGTK